MARLWEERPLRVNGVELAASDAPASGSAERLARAIELLSAPPGQPDGTDGVLRALASLLGADTVDLLPAATAGAVTDAVMRSADAGATDAPDATASDVLARRTARASHDSAVLEALGMATGLWVPVVVGGGALGVLRVAWAQVRGIDDVDLRIATAGACRLAVALDRDLLVQQLDQRRRQRRTTLGVATELAGELDVAALARRIVEGVTEVTDFTVATLTVRDGDTCQRIAAAGIDDARIGLRTDYARWHDLLREEFRRGSICFLIPPQASDTPWVQTVEVPTAVGPVGDRDAWTEEHGLVVELLDDTGGRIGFLSVDAPASGLLPDHEEFEQLELFARQAQTGLRNAWLHEEIRRQRDAAEALGSVGQAVSSSLDLREVLRRCSDAVVARSVADRASVYLFDERSGAFRAVMSRGQHDPELWRKFRAMPPATVDTVPAFARAMRTGAPVLLPHVGPEHVRAGTIETFSLKSMAVYPLRSGERFVGLLVVDTFREHVDFNAHEVELVARIAAQAAVAIHQAQLHENAHAHAARAGELYDLTKEMTRTFDFDTVFARIVTAVTGRTDAYSVGLMEVVDGHLQLLRSNLDAARDAGLPYERLPVADVPAEVWRQLVEVGSVVLHDVQESDLAPYARSVARSLLIAGHREDGELTLVLHISSERVGAFDEHDAAFADGLVEVAALALRNARLYETTRHAAERDSLTGLKNRRMYWEELAPLVADASPDAPVALAVLDVDDFKAVNDGHGHDVGDRALVHVADRIGRSIRETDHAYRLGGEEFTVVMPATTAIDAMAVVDRIRESIAVTRTGLPPLTISAGVATVPGDATDVEALFRAADTALYGAKAAGKDTVRLAGT